MSESRWYEGRILGKAGDGSLRVAVDCSEEMEKGKHILVRLRRSRNPKHHRLYWGMVRKVVDSCDGWETPEQLHRWLKYQLGLYQIYAIEGERVIIEWDSTNFDAMDQSEFEDFFRRSVAIIALETGIDPLAFAGDL